MLDESTSDVKEDEESRAQRLHVLETIPTAVQSQPVLPKSIIDKM